MKFSDYKLLKQNILSLRNTLSELHEKETHEKIKENIVNFREQLKTFIQELSNIKYSD